MARAIVLASALALIVGAAPGAWADHGPSDGTLSGTATVVASWFWEHSDGSGGLGANDRGVLRINWSETYADGARVAAHAEIIYVGALGNAACEVRIDDTAGTSSVAGTIHFLVRGGALPCRGASAFEGRPDANGICGAGASLSGWKGDGPPVTSGRGSGTGPCEETLTDG